jgi:hypothetical protein
MHYRRLILTSVSLLLMYSCNSNKKTLEDNTIMMSDKSYIENGFKKATVIYSEVEGDCPYTISVEGESTLFDPINLGEDYKISQATIWVKYHPLRMANRCDKANPVEITDIDSRK